MFHSWKIYNQLFIRLLLLLLGIGLTAYLLLKNLVYSGGFIAFITLLFFIEMYFFIKNAFLVYDRTIASILQNDFSADFSKHKSFKNYTSLFRLYENLKSKQNEQVSKDIIYRSILNNIETGILILQKEENDWNIFLMNNFFSMHFAVPKVSKWHYLKNHLPSLCELIEQQGFEEIKSSLEIRVNRQDTQTFIMQASKSRIYDQEYYIVLLDSIQKVIEKKEKEAWINLMKVISHELLNSLTPISSLSQNLEVLVQQDELSKDDLEDIRQSVVTMNNRSNHLQQFVESYRKLAMLPTPKKEKISLTELIDNSIRIMSPLFKKGKIEMINNINFNRWLNIDKQQMEQVFINLFTNSMYAMEESKTKQITITAELKDKRIFIAISDSGKGIEKEIEDKIFLPFFTTRKEGAGVGLTLSKNIIEAHGGYLAFQNDDGRTSFVICLME